MWMVKIELPIKTEKIICDVCSIGSNRQLNATIYLFSFKETIICIQLKLKRYNFVLSKWYRDQNQRSTITFQKLHSFHSFTIDEFFCSHKLSFVCSKSPLFCSNSTPWINFWNFMKILPVNFPLEWSIPKS